MSKKKKVIYEESKIVTDKETGEVIQETSKVIKKVAHDEFMQVYLDDLKGIMSIENKSQLKVLVELWKLAKFNTNQVIIVKAVKQQIADNIGIAYKTVDNHIVKMQKSGLLIRKDRSVYYLNPKYFFKGYLENRPKLIRFIVEYQIKNEK